MDFYHANEGTPLLKVPTSPRSDGEDNILQSPSTVSRVSSNRTTPMGSMERGSSSSNRCIQTVQTELQLSVDKVSFIYSPKSQNYSSFHDPSNALHDDELSILDPYFDVTTSRLRAAFNGSSPDGTKDFYCLAESSA